MKNEKKKKYVSPSIIITHIEMEKGITASSFTVRTGGSGNEPQIEDWDTSTDSKIKNFDL